MKWKKRSTVAFLCIVSIDVIRPCWGIWRPAWKMHTYFWASLSRESCVGTSFLVARKDSKEFHKSGGLFFLSSSPANTLPNSRCIRNKEQGILRLGRLSTVRTSPYVTAFRGA